MGTIPEQTTTITSTRNLDGMPAQHSGQYVAVFIPPSARQHRADRIILADTQQTENQPAPISWKLRQTLQSGYQTPRFSDDGGEEGMVAGV